MQIFPKIATAMPIPSNFWNFNINEPYAMSEVELITRRTDILGKMESGNLDYL
jgi:hypothetical protein